MKRNGMYILKPYICPICNNKLIPVNIRGQIIEDNSSIIYGLWCTKCTITFNIKWDFNNQIPYPDMSTDTMSVFLQISDNKEE